MNLHTSFTLLLFCATVVGVRDYYAGWFNIDDILVAQDSVFQERRFYRRVTAHYTRTFKCPISYYRVLDRLGTGTGPITKVLKGGLRKHFISLRITSAYSFPISVNIYIGCQNRLGTGPMFTRPPWTRKKSDATEQPTGAGSSTKAGETTPAGAAAPTSTEQLPNAPGGDDKSKNATAGDDKSKNATGGDDNSQKEKGGADESKTPTGGDDNSQKEKGGNDESKNPTGDGNNPKDAAQPEKS